VAGRVPRDAIPRARGKLEEPCAVGVQRLCRDRLDRRREAVVERASLDCELGTRLCELALQHDDLVGAPPALEKRRTHGEVDAERAGREADDEGEYDHRADER